MWTTRLLQATFGLVLALTVSPSGSSPMSDPYDRQSSFHQDVEWVSPQEGVSAQGLFFFQSSAKGLASRVLVRSPAGRRVVLTNVLLVATGRDRARMLDDQSGWWAEVEKDYGFTASGLWEFFRKADVALMPGEGRKIKYTVRTSEGLEITSELPVQSHSDPAYRVLAALLVEASLAESLRSQIPEGLGEVVVFLEHAVDQVGSTSRGPAVVLAALVEHGPREESYTRLSWSEEEGPLRKGLTLKEPSLLGFADGFRSVGGAEPLPPGELDYWASL